MLVKIIVAIFIFSLSCSNAMAAWLVTDPNGTISVCDTQPTSGQIHAGATVLQLPTGYTVSQLPYMQSDGHGNAVYVAPTIAPSTAPNPTLFISTIQADPTIQPIFYLLAPYQFTIMQYSSSTAPAIKTLWAQLCATYGGSGPLSSALQTRIQNIAINANMALQ